MPGDKPNIVCNVSTDRDTARWKLDASETQKRREVFWELYVYDSWQASKPLHSRISPYVFHEQSLAFGRPPSFATPQVDCKMPFPQEPSVDDACQYFTRPMNNLRDLTLTLVSTWKHKFSSECIAPVHDQVFGAKMPTYATILQLDRKLRAYQVPPVLQIAGFGSSSSEPPLGSYPESIPLILQRHIVLAIREMSTHSSVIHCTLADGPCQICCTCTAASLRAH